MDRVVRSSIFAIAGRLIAKELRKRSGVYEFTNQHGFHNFRRIKALITNVSEIDGSVDDAQWHKKAEAQEAFLRQEFKNLVRDAEGPTTQDVWQIFDDGKFLKEKILSNKFEVISTRSRVFYLDLPQKVPSVTAWDVQLALV